MKIILLLITISFLITACTPGETVPAATSTSEAPPALTATPTPDPALLAMIVETNGANTYIHDPVMIKAGDTYYVFSSGPGIPIHCSKDMKVWDTCGRVFGANPDWAVAAIEGVKDLWAPDIVFYNGKYYLFYAASTFGSNRSAIGLATNTTLDPHSPEYAWKDEGEVISSQRTSDYNAIDPNLAFDTDGQPWLALGSFWSGIKMVKVDPATLKPATEEALISLAAKPGSDAIEGAFITRHGDYYYLFVSHDYCCKGVMSSYNIRVGRSVEITGPYLDRDGQPLVKGGGTLVYEGSKRWRGPGHNSIYQEGEKDFLVYHTYDALVNGVPTLHIEQLFWDADGWPLAPSALIGQ